MKKRLLILLSVVFILQGIFIYGCGKAERDPNTAINFLKNLKSYSCDVEISVKNNKETNTYTASESYMKTTGYRMDLNNDRIYIYKDNKLYVSDKNNGLSYITDKNSDGIYRLSFIGEYVTLLYSNEGLKYNYRNISGEDYQLIEIILPGNNRNMSKAVLYVNINTNLPEKLFIYDSGNKERVEIVYKDFKPNIDISSEQFTIK